MARSLLQLLALVALGATCLHRTCAIETVDELIVSKYLGRWYQVRETSDATRALLIAAFSAVRGPPSLCSEPQDVIILARSNERVFQLLGEL